MSLAAWTKLMFFGTLTALIYIHMQMQIVELAYRGKDKQKHMHELMENNGSLTHQILTLKSANNLGQELLGKNEGLEFMGHDKVMTFSGPVPRALIRPPEKPKVKPESPMWNWLSFFSPREAKAWDR